MDLKSVERLMRLYDKKVVTANEVANSLVVEMMESAGPDAALIPFVDSLPDEVRQSLLRRVQAIHEAEYRWRPFMIGPGGPVLGSDTADWTRLRQICGALGIA